MPHFPNRLDFEDGFWKHNYRVLVTAQGIEFIVNADCEQDALDFVIDDCELHYPGLVEHYHVLAEQGLADAEIDEYICGGNHALYLTTHNVRVILLDTKAVNAIKEKLDLTFNTEVLDNDGENG